jgi:hypothetical protein
VKRGSLDARIAALEAKMRPQGLRIRLEGGISADELERRRADKPPGSDLKAQHRAFGRGKGLLKTGTGGDGDLA